MSSLTNQFISNTYKGVLHAGGVQIPSTTPVRIFDGQGQETSLLVGLDGGGVEISGLAKITGNETVSGTLTIGGLTTINDNAAITGTLNVTGATTIAGTTTINDNLNVSVNTNITGTLTVGGFTVINDNLQVNGQTDTNTLKVGALNYPATASTNGYVVYQQNSTTLALIDPENIITSGDTNIVTRTTYIATGVADPITVPFDNPIVDVFNPGGHWVQVNIPTSIVPTTARAIIGFLMFPSDYITSDEDWYAIYASRNGSNGNAILIQAAGGSQDDSGSSSPAGAASQFQSRIINNQIYFKVVTNAPDRVIGNWRLFIIAHQQ